MSSKFIRHDNGFLLNTPDILSQNIPKKIKSDSSHLPNNPILIGISAEYDWVRFQSRKKLEYMDIGYIGSARIA
jgi:hypothetical protein